MMDIHRKKFMSEHTDFSYSNDVPFDPESLAAGQLTPTGGTKEGSWLGFVGGKDFVSAAGDNEESRIRYGYISDTNTVFKSEGCEDRIPNERRIREIRAKHVRSRQP